MADKDDAADSGNTADKHRYNTRSKDAPRNAKRKLSTSVATPATTNTSSSQINSFVKDEKIENMVDTDIDGEGHLNVKKYRAFLNDIFPSSYMQAKSEATKDTVVAPHHLTVTPSPAPNFPSRIPLPSRRAPSPSSSTPVLQRFNITFTVQDPKRRKGGRKSFIVDDDDEEYDDESALDDDEDDDDDDDDDDDEDDTESALDDEEYEGEDGEEDDEEDGDESALDEEEDDNEEYEGAANSGMQVDDDDMYLKDLTEFKNEKLKYRNTLKFRKLMQDKHPSANDLHYFNAQLSVAEQEKILLHVAEVNKHNNTDKPYRLALLESTVIPLNYKAVALRKINTLRSMGPSSGEYFKIKHWVEGFMQIPFGVYHQLPLTLQADGIDKCHAFMSQAKKTLDSAVYGLNDAKLQIMQMVGQWLVNPQAIGSAIAIKGPMGTGKTTLVKEGISQILGRDFAFIALGGATDSAFLEGHSYTYEGSGWGQIVDILMKSKSMNPVIYFDELDKVSETAKGEEIIGILTHLTDTTQNSKFHDRYYAEFEFDLSRCLFIFSYNDESKINPILRDRMYRIMTKGYDQAEKITIASDFLLPKIQEQVRFSKDDVIFSPAILEYIIMNYTDKEDGVRNLKRCLEIIHTKLNLFRLMTPGDNLFQNDLKLTPTEVIFPIVVSTLMVDMLIKREPDTGGWRNMYM